MRVTVHRVEVALYHRDEVKAVWWEHDFIATDPVNLVQADGVNVVWSMSRAIVVETPALCRVETRDLPADFSSYGKTPAVLPARRRLVSHDGAMILDAASVAHLAERGERGFRLATAAAELPTAPAEPKRWGIAFQSRTYHGRTFLHRSSCTPGGPVCSTRNLAEVAEWSEQRFAAGWMRGRDWSPDRPVSPGLDYLYPEVAEIPAELPGWGVEFELSRGLERARPDQKAGLDLPAELPAPLPASNREKPSRRREPVGQLAFSF